MNIKEEIKGCWAIITTLLIILIIVVLAFFVLGSIGDILFKIASVLQNNMWKILLVIGASIIIVWIFKILNSNE